MNELVQSSTYASARVNLRDLADLPGDMVALIAASNDLDARQLGVWHRLRMHLFMYGRTARRHEGASQGRQDRRGKLRAHGGRARPATSTLDLTNAGRITPSLGRGAAAS